MKNNPIDLESLGIRIKELRLKQGLTQERFADDVHISTSYLALLETGKRTASIDVLALIASSCSVSMDYLLFGVSDSVDSSNTRHFHKLCQDYPAHKISQALALAEYYLKLED